MQVYITPYPEATRRASQPSQPVPAPSVQQACGMFGGARVVSSSRRLVVLDLGGGQWMAVSDYAFL